MKKENLSALSLAATRELCDKSFYWFVRIVGGWARQGGCATQEIHKPLCDFFQDNISKRKAIFMPRGWLKSTILTQWGSIWLYLQNPDTKILIASQNENIAARFMYFIKQQLLTNTLLRKLYPELEQVNEDWLKSKSVRWSQECIDLPRPTIYKEATITCIGVTGASQSGHYDWVIIDDPVGQKHIDSPIELERVLRWHDNVKELLVSANWMSSQGSTICLACTFWGVGDYGSYVMENYPEFQWRIVPIFREDEKEIPDALKKENIRWVQNPGSHLGESNWEDAPDDKGKTALFKDMMANPQQQMIFWAQHMNMPHKSGLLTKIDPSWFRWFHFEERDDGKYIVCDDDKEVFKLSKIQLFGMIDPGGFAEIKLAKRGSRNAIIIGGQPTESIKKFIVYSWAGRPPKPSDFLKEVFNAHDTWKPRLWRIETIGAQEYIKRDIMQESEKRGRRLPIASMEKTNRAGEKDDDIQALIPRYQNGEIYMRREMKDLIAEVTNYPHGLTNDLADMVGKLNKYCWTRKPRKNIEELNKQLDKKYWESRSSISGY